MWSFSLIYVPQPEDGISALPAQAAGVYFGWAQVGICTIFKAVVGIIFDSPSAMRKLVGDQCALDQHVCCYPSETLSDLDLTIESFHILFCSNCV